MPELTTAELAALCETVVEGDHKRVISGANTLDAATETDIAFADNPKSFEAVRTTQAGCVVVPPDFDRASSGSLIRTKAVRAAFARAVGAIYAQPPVAPAIHSSAVIDSSANVSSDASIGAYVTVGAGASIAAHCSIGAGCRIGDRVVIGEGSTLQSNVTLYSGVRIGRRVTVHAGAVVGADGFGYIFSGDRYDKFPQVGTVDIEDEVEIGANCCIDRAALGITRVGTGTKLDNLVHVGHNCTIGKHVVIAAQTGLSGSVTIGDYAVIGGQAGVGEKANIAPKSIIGGKAGVLTGQHVEAGEPVWGIPARPLRQHLRNLAHVSKLGELMKRVKDLEKRTERA